MSMISRVGVSWRRALALSLLFGVVLALGGCGSSPAPSASSAQKCATSQAGPILYALVASLAASGQGITSTTLEALDAQRGCLLWQVSQAGQMQYALGQGSIYLVTRPDFVYSTTPKMSTIFAYDARTGALRWKVQEPVAGGIIATPGGLLFVETSNGSIAVPNLTYVALGAADGKPQWMYQTTLNMVVSGTTGYLYGLGRFPNLQYPNAVTALDLATGAERWQVGQPTTPLWLVADSQAVYLGEEGAAGQVNTLVALSAQDGQPLWQFQAPDGMQPPASDGSTLYLSTSPTPTANSTPRGTLIALTAADGKERWSVPSDPLFGLTIANQTLFAGLGYGAVGYGKHGVDALMVSDGSVRWKVGTQLGAQAPVVANGLVAIGLSGEVQGGPGTDSIEALSAADGSVRWTIQTGGILQEALSLSAGG